MTPAAGLTCGTVAAVAPGFLQRMLGRQLGDPSGWLGNRVVGALNKRNYQAIEAAVAALELHGGEAVADIGYGGGVGLRLLLDAVGETGRVHGIEPSLAMVERSRKDFREYVTSGRLALHQAAMASLPLTDDVLDGWISLNTIYFIDDLAPSFAALARVLKPTGRGVLGVADPGWLASQPYAEHGFAIRPIDDVVAALERARLRAVVDTRTNPETKAGYNLIICSKL